MKPFPPHRAVLAGRIASSFVLAPISLIAAPVVWDNSNATGAWSTGANWDTNIEPTAADDLTFPLGLGGTITTSTTENALSLTFNDAYTLSGGTLALASGNSINVAVGVTATINNALSITGGLSKTGTGTLVLGASNTNPGGTVISAGKIRAANAGALGTTGIVTTVNGGTILEVANAITLDRPITLMHGGTVAGLGTAINNGKITIDAAATLVTLATDQAGDVFSVGNGANDVTGGTSATVIGLSGPGAVRLGGASDFDGSWSIPSGRLELGAAAALGDQAASSVTLSGGTLSARLATATTFTGPAANLVVTANSGLLSDRSSVSGGVTHILGTLSMGHHTLTVAPGASATSGTAGITLGNVTFTGNPVLAINDSGATNGKLTTGSLLGGSARSIVKTGAGDLAVTGGATDLPTGSTFTATGGGSIEMLFPSLGVTTPVAITAAQNPFGEASLSVTDGALRLLADGSGTSATQTYQLPTTISLGGAVTLDPDRRTAAANTNKTFELTGLSLAADTVLGMSGNNIHGVRLTGPLALSGDASLQGVTLANQDGLLTLNGGISGAAGDSLTIAGGTSPMNLTIGAASTYGGGTTMSGSNVTLNAANALGSGATTLSGGSLIVNAADALVGTVTLSGGTLRVNEATFLANNSVSLQGGTLDLRNNAGASISTTSLTLSGSSTINLANNGSGSSQTMIVPLLNVTGDSTLTLTNANSYSATFTSLTLAGSLTVNNGITARIQSITEDASARTLVKTGVGVLELEGASTHSGGTEVLAGTLLVEHASALGSGALTVGASSGTATATAQFGSGLSIANGVVVRSGSSGIATLDSPTGGVTWSGGLSLQKSVTFDNGSSTVLSSFNGVISGSGDITKISAGEIVLGNAANSFTGTIAISDGTLSVASDGALGDPSNGITLAGDAILKIDATFATSRTITSNGTTNSVSVSGANDFTVNSPLAGAGTFLKSGTGILTLSSSLDSSARGAAVSGVTGGTLRVQGVKNLSDTGVVTLNGAAGTIEFLRDADTTFPHPVTADGTGTLHVDRAIGGAGTNGRHTLGTLSMASGNLTVTGANGYGLNLGAATVSSNNTIINNAAAVFRLASLTGNPGSSALTETFGGSGDIEITGALAEGAGTGNYGIIKTGPGTLSFGASVAEFGRVLTVNDGKLDLNGLAYPVTGLVTLGGAASVLGAEIDTGAIGSLVLGAGVTFSSTSSPAGARITGNLGLGTTLQAFTVNDSSGASVDLTLDGPTTGGVGSSIAKSGAGTLRFTGTGNTLPGPVTVSAGLLELSKTSGDAIGTGGLAMTGGTTRSLAAGQINDSGAVSLNSANEVFLELNGFSETTGPLTITQSDASDYSAVKTDASGTLVLNGDLSLNNNSNSSFADGREVLITGTGSEFTPSTDGFLDLGGATRTIHVTTTTVGANEPKANATIETQILNGGILKTGPRTLFLTNPNNTFAGGLQIAGGTVKSSGGNSLGLGPVTFSNALGVAAGIDFGNLTGPIADNFTLTGVGDVTFTYSGLAPNTLVLGGNFSSSQNLIFDVVNGSTANGDTATLDLTGVIDDAASSIGLTKVGNGTLRLDAGNIYSGSTTVQKGVLSIAADSALGDSTADLVIDGGCLFNTASFALGRDLVFGANGGSVRGSAATALDIPALEWGAGASAFFGSGHTILSGTTTGSGGNLTLGLPTAFATASSSLLVGSGHVLSLRGTAALPAGNLNFANKAVLELGNGDFTRALGTGPGEVQLATATGGGWAAHGANRAVNLGGASAPVVWGQQTPPFLYQVVSGDDHGDLILGSVSGTHTVDFQNLIDLNNGTTSVFRDLIVNDGPAAVDARISGGIRQTADPNTTFTVLDLECAGTLEISGPVSGEIHLDKLGTGTAILSGSNSYFGDLSVYEGTLEIATNASWGTPGYVYIETGATLDVSSMTTPIGLPVDEYIGVYGTLLGDVSTPSYLEGNGLLDGDLHAQAASYLYPDFNGLLHVTGDFTLDAAAVIDFYADGLVPQMDYNRMRVGGAVNLSGGIYLYGVASLVVNDSFVFILNDGADPINGTFAGLPEGAGIPIGNGLALQVTYLANGDGGAVGNDFGATVVVDTFSTDLALTVNAPLAVDFGSNFTINYTVENFGPANSTGSTLAIPLPVNAVLVGSTPAGTVNAGTLTIPVPALTASSTTIVTVQFTAPGTEAAVLVEPVLTASGIDGDVFNSQATSVTAVMAGGCVILSTFDVDQVNGEITLGIDTITGVSYVLQSSTGLDVWSDDSFFAGDGQIQEFIVPITEPKEFFRFRIVP